MVVLLHMHQICLLPCSAVSMVSNISPFFIYLLHKNSPSKFWLQSVLIGEHSSGFYGSIWFCRPCPQPDSKLNHHIQGMGICLHSPGNLFLQFFVFFFLIWDGVIILSSAATFCWIGVTSTGWLDMVGSYYRDWEEKENKIKQVWNLGWYWYCWRRSVF